MWMWEGRSEHAWAQTSLLAYLTAEANRDPKRRRRPFEAADFNPHAGCRNAEASRPRRN
jgi:hypothetical protein